MSQEHYKTFFTETHEKTAKYSAQEMQFILTLTLTLKKTTEEVLEVYNLAISKEERNCEALRKILNVIDHPNQLPIIKEHNTYFLHHYVIKGQINCVKELLTISPKRSEVKDQSTRSIYNMALQQIIDQGDPNCFTPLMLAAGHKHNEIIKTLLEHGAQTRIVNQNGWTALHFAALNGTPECINTLVSADKCLINLFTNKEGEEWLRHKTPLMIASDNRLAKVMLKKPDSKDLECNLKALLELGADKNLKNMHEMSALLIAAQHSERGIVRALLENDNSMMDTSKNDIDASLILAANRDNHEALRVLIDYKADVTGTCKEGYTPLHIAILSNSENCLKILCKYKRALNHKVDLDGDIDFALKHNKKEAAKKLYKAGSEFSYKSDQAPSTLARALKNYSLGIDDIVFLLKDKKLLQQEEFFCIKVLLYASRKVLPTEQVNRALEGVSNLKLSVQYNLREFIDYITSFVQTSESLTSIEFNSFYFYQGFKEDKDKMLKAIENSKSITSLVFVTSLPEFGKRKCKFGMARQQKAKKACEENKKNIKKLLKLDFMTEENLKEFWAIAPDAKKCAEKLGLDFLHNMLRTQAPFADSIKFNEAITISLLRDQSINPSTQEASDLLTDLLDKDPELLKHFITYSQFTFVRKYIENPLSMYRTNEVLKQILEVPFTDDRKKDQDYIYLLKILMDRSNEFGIENSEVYLDGLHWIHEKIIEIMRTSLKNKEVTDDFYCTIRSKIKEMPDCDTLLSSLLLKDSGVEEMQTTPDIFFRGTKRKLCEAEAEEEGLPAQKKLNTNYRATAEEDTMDVSGEGPIYDTDAL